MPSWPPEAIELLRAEWTAGSSGSQCAAILSKQFGREITRNSVIGKAHRLGLPAHPTAVSRSITANRQRQAHRQRQQIVGIRRKGRDIATQLEQAAPIPGEAVYYKSVPFFELQSHHCRYAVSGNHGRNYKFCGNDKWKRSSYCLEHTRVTSATAIARSEGQRFSGRKVKVPTENMLLSLFLKEESETP